VFDDSVSLHRMESPNAANATMAARGMDEQVATRPPACAAKPPV